MNYLKSAIATATMAAVTFLTVSSANAEIAPFASYSQIGTSSTIRWEKVGATGGNIYTIASPTSTVAGSITTSFKFLDPTLAALGDLSSSFTLTGTAGTGGAVTASGFIFQPILLGDFSFIYSGLSPLVINHTTYLTGANLLSAHFTIGTISGQNHGSSGALSSSTMAEGTITYTSDFLNFADTTAQDFAIGLASIYSPVSTTTTTTTKVAAIAAQNGKKAVAATTKTTTKTTVSNGGLFQTATGQSVSTFTASSNGLFSSNPTPSVSAIVPEPSVWGMLVVGFGLVGVQYRRRSMSVAS